jgi:hypothetical protein
MRRIVVSSFAALALVLSLSSCSKQQTATDTTTMGTDSLLASNPVEQPAGDITPQGQYQTPEPATPASAPMTPAPKPATKHTSTTHTPTPEPAPVAHAHPGVTVESGTALNISVGNQISSEFANVGDTWSGELKENVIVGDRVVFPAGSIVSGTVTEAVPAQKGGTLARLGLEVNAITVNGTKHAISAGTEPIEAGSARARNLGAVAGSAAAGALIGKVVGGGKGALIGGLLGAGAAGVGVAKSKGYQVVLKEGTAVTFTVKQPTTVPVGT